MWNNQDQVNMNSSRCRRNDCDCDDCRRRDRDFDDCRRDRDCDDCRRDRCDHDCHCRCRSCCFRRSRCGCMNPCLGVDMVMFEMMMKNMMNNNNNKNNNDKD